MPSTPTPAVEPLTPLPDCFVDLVDAVRGLPVEFSVVVPDKRWGFDSCGTCPEPADGGPETPEPAVAYIRREFTVGNTVSVFREPVCETCLRSAVHYELECRAPRPAVVCVDLIAGAA